MYGPYEIFSFFLLVGVDHVPPALHDNIGSAMSRQIIPVAAAMDHPQGGQEDSAPQC